MKRYILNFLLLSLFVFFIYGQSEGEHGNTGGDMGGISQNGGENSQAGGEISEKDVNALWDEQLEREKELAEAMKQEQMLAAELNDIKNDLANAEAMLSNAMEDEGLQKKVETLKKQVEAKEKDYNYAVQDRQQKAEAYSKASEKLSQAYEAIGVSGDPVRVATGEFIFQCEDFIAQDYHDKFKVIRNYGAYDSSFGKNWSCSLDSRIIRCVPKSYNTLLSKNQKVLEICEKLEDKIKIFIKNYPDKENEYKNDLEELKRKINNIKANINFIIQRETEISEINNFNKFAAYGFFSSAAKRSGNSDEIIFIDKQGNTNHCFYKNGKYVPAGKIGASEFCIFGLNQKGNISNSNDNRGGFVVAYENGMKDFFNSYGILEKSEDLFGNRILFVNEKGKIVKCINKTSEEIYIQRDKNNLIVSIEGNISGKSTFSYTNGYLSSSEDNQGYKLGFTYFSDGIINRISKSDESYISINYEYYSDYKKKLVSSVTNENGQTEYFHYDWKNKKITRLAYDKRTEEYILDDNNCVIYHKNVNGLETFFTVNELGLITKIKKNGLEYQYVYNENFHPVKTVFNDGSFDLCEYNQFGRISFIQDRDGFSTQYVYDSTGNITKVLFQNMEITTADYYSNGLIKNIWENGNHFYYEYNNLGSVIKKSTNGLCEYWTYDSKNRLIEYSDKGGKKINHSYLETSDYNNFNIEEIRDSCGLEVKKYYSKSGDLIKEIQKDIVSEIEISKDLFYDSRHNVIKVLMNNQILEELSYNQNDLIQSQKIYNEQGQYEIVDYVYDQQNHLIQKGNGFVKQEFLHSNDGVELRVYYGQKISQYFFNSEGYLIKKQLYDGTYEEREYTKAGRLKTITDSSGTEKRFYYNLDGTVEVIEKIITAYESKTRAKYYYDLSQRLIRIESGQDIQIYEYNSFGQIERITGPYYKTEYVYDVYGRIIDELIILLEKNQTCYKKKIIYSDDNRQQMWIYGNDDVIEVYNLDAWQRIVKAQTKNGIYSYKYNYLGLCTSQTDDFGTETVFSYTPAGLLLSQNTANSNEYSYTYDKNGFLTEEHLNNHLLNNYEYSQNGELLSFYDETGNKKSFIYDDLGKVSEIKSFNDGVIKYVRIDNQDGTYFIERINEMGGKYRQKYNSLNRLLEETDSLGNTIYYSYDLKDRIIKVQDSENNIKTIEYDSFQNKITCFFNGMFYSSIKKDALGNILELESKNNKIIYKYNSAGLLEKECNFPSGIEIEYSYDKKGNCIKKKSQGFEFIYGYNSLGLLDFVEDRKSQNKISFFYNKNNQEIKRVYSNGIEFYTEYNSLGQKKLEYGKEPYGAVFTGNIYIYNGAGKLELLCNHKGEVTRFFYDSEGRFSKIYYPYNQVKDFFKNQASLLGIFLKEEPAGNVLDISYEAAAEINNNLKQIGCRNQIDKNQHCFSVEYFYNTSGAVSKEKNSFGEIILEYDSENRLVKKYGANSEISKIDYLWSPNGNLRQIVSSVEKITFYYGEFSRPIKIRTEDLNTGEIEIINYEYDGLGRRITEKKENSVANTFIYDGTGTEIIFNSPLYANNSAVSNYLWDSQKLIDDTDFEYRLLPENYDEYFYGIENNFDENYRKNEHGPEAFLLVNKFPLLKVVCDYSVAKGFSGEFMFEGAPGKTVGAVCDDIGNCIGIPVYDVWGQSIYSDFAGTEFSYSNSIYKLNTNMEIYDLGYRDYCPALKTFTTRDPLREGENWYSYCGGDCVNFYDSYGFDKQGMNEVQRARYIATIAKIGAFDSTTYKDDGESQGILAVMDCADTSALIDYLATKAAGYDTNSERQKLFNEAMAEGNVQKARNVVQSTDFSNPNNTDSYTKKTAGYDRDYLRNVMGVELTEDKEIAKEIENQFRKELTYAQLSHPENVSPGTVLVWEKSKTPVPKADGEWVGHTMTVIARNYDEDGNVIGIMYIEGHTGGGKTEVGYMSFVNTGEKGIYTLDSWYGDFKGAYEIEATGTKECNSK